MISTWRSESANRMVKSHVPPGCPMHMFVKHYMRLQFARDSEESYEEKRTKTGWGDRRELQHVDREAHKHFVMKRWIRDSRDMLPPHLQVNQRDQAGSRTMTHRQWRCMSMLWSWSVSLMHAWMLTRKA